MTSCSRLADDYLSGNGVRQDEAMAIRLHLKVCEGPPNEMAKFSCATIGQVLLREAGEHRDFLKGVAYLSRACALGLDGACVLHDLHAGTGFVSSHEPPKGAIGFTFGWTIKQVEGACAEFPGRWSPAQKHGGGRVAECRFHANALDRDVSASLGFADGVLVWIQADYEPGPGDAIGEHNRVGGLLRASYGPPSGRRAIVLDACQELTFAACLVQKAAEFEMWWGFKDQHSHILLSLTGLANGKVLVSLLYDTSGSDKLIGHPGL
jgi:hypothetical protein